MKIRTEFSPSDTTGAAVNFRGVYTLADLAKLGSDLAAAGVQPTDALQFVVDPTGKLTVIHETETGS